MGNYRIVIIFLAVALITGSMGVRAGIEDGLVGYWAFNEGSGGTAWDSSGNGNHGTIHGASYVEGVDGGALSFDGVNDYVVVTDDPVLNFGQRQDFSLAAWFKAKPDQLSYQGTLLAKLNPPSGIPRRTYGYSLLVRGLRDETNKGKTGVWMGDGDVNTAGITLGLYSHRTYDDDNWHHVAATIDRDSAATIYIDGRFANSIDISDLAGIDQSYPENLEIGREGVLDVYFFNGLMDEIRIYDRVLSCDDILTLAEPLFPRDEMKEDFSEDGGVDIQDLRILAGEWLQIQELKADIYPECGDGVVNLLDFVEFARKWMYL